MTSAYGTLTKKAFSSVETLNTILEELPESLDAINILTMEAVYQDLRATRDELLSALRKVALASTTERQTSGKTKSTSTLNGIPEAIVENVEARPPLTDAEWEQLVDSNIPGMCGVAVSPTTEPVEDEETCECFEDWHDCCPKCCDQCLKEQE